MTGLQLLSNLFGISVFGSAVIRVEPDIVSLRFAVSRTEPHPKEAFQKVREAAANVQQYLASASIDEVGVSRVELSNAFENDGNRRRFVGYEAKVEFHVLLRDLRRTDEILSGIVDVGVNSIKSVQYQTTQLQSLRAQARERAVNAARQKAEIYCQASGARLGRVLHIEDMNPNVLRGSEGHVSYEMQPDDGGGVNAFSPDSITVSGVVAIAFTLDNEA